MSADKRLSAAKNAADNQLHILSQKNKCISISLYTCVSLFVSLLFYIFNLNPYFYLIFKILNEYASVLNDFWKTNNIAKTRGPMVL